MADHVASVKRNNASSQAAVHSTVPNHMFKSDEAKLLARGDNRVNRELLESWFPAPQSINKCKDFPSPYSALRLCLDKVVNRAESVRITTVPGVKVVVGDPCIRFTVTVEQQRIERWSSPPVENSTVLVQLQGRLSRGRVIRYDAELNMCIVRLDYSNRVVNKGLEDIFPDDPNLCSDPSASASATAVSTTASEEATCSISSSSQTGNELSVAPATAILARTVSLHSVITSHTESTEPSGGPPSIIATTELASVPRRPHRYSEGSTSHLQWETSSRRFPIAAASWLSRIPQPTATPTVSSPAVVVASATATSRAESLSPNQIERAPSLLPTPSDTSVGDLPSVGQLERSFDSRKRLCTDETEGVRLRHSSLSRHQSRSSIGSPVAQAASEISPGKRIRPEVAVWSEPSSSSAREYMENPSQLPSNVLIPWGLLLKSTPKITGTSALDLLLMTESEVQQFRQKASTELLPTSSLASSSLQFHGQPGPSSSSMQTCHSSPSLQTSAVQGVESQVSPEEAGPSTSIMRHQPSESIPTETVPGALTTPTLAPSREHPPTSVVTDVTAAAATYPPEHISQSSFRPSEAAKCRRVYGAVNKSKWCKQCRWKKACTRFQGPPRSP
ncbi:hypothetical protein SprV_0200744600 [Sparganum proliferum]